MSTLINAATLDRLKWIMAELQTMHDNGWVRYEGDTVFFGARDELTSIISDAQEPVTVAAPTVYNVVTAEQLALVGADLAEKVADSVVVAMSAQAPTIAPTAAPTEAPASA
jgi:hypothetical protein